MSLWPKAAMVWLTILGCAVGNGALREGLLVPAFGAVPATLVSGVILCVVILLVTALAGRWFGPQPPARLWQVGAAWLGATIAFELSFALLRGESFEAIAAAYTFRGGNLWPLILLTTLVAPRLVGGPERAVAGSSARRQPR
ncbi:MAG: hypothetical protein KDE27_25845 [Planctomycetes bacterium]|nr:hypothetical protein [Planctomycetota bacterium]